MPQYIPVSLPINGSVKFYPFVAIVAKIAYANALAIGPDILVTEAVHRTLNFDACELLIDENGRPVKPTLDHTALRAKANSVFRGLGDGTPADLREYKNGVSSLGPIVIGGEEAELENRADVVQPELEPLYGVYPYRAFFSNGGVIVLAGKKGRRVTTPNELRSPLSKSNAGFFVETEIVRSKNSSKVAHVLHPDIAERNIMLMHQIDEMIVEQGLNNPPR